MTSALHRRPSRESEEQVDGSDDGESESDDVRSTERAETKSLDDIIEEYSS